MACAKCTQKRRFNNVPVAPNRSLLTGETFVNAIYIGPTGEVNSVLPIVSYGFRENGKAMKVAQKDMDAHPELWELIK